MSESYVKQIESIAAIAASHAAEVDRGTFPAATIRALGEAGLLGLISSPEVGGRGEGMAAAAHVVERLARECASSGMVLCMHYCATAVVEQYGPLEVRRAIAAGNHLTTLAVSEFGSRSQFWVPIGTATPDGDQIRLTAKKSFTTSAHHADSYVWSSKPVASSELSTIWLVPRTTAGLRQSETSFDGIGLRGNDSSPIIAEDVRIPASARLGGDGEGTTILMNIAMPLFNVLASMVSVGLMETAVARTATHVAGTQFQHAGTSIADLPTVRAYVARMRIKTDQNKALLADTIAAMTDKRADAMLRMLECKAAAGEAAAEVTDLAMRVCGGAAFRKDVAVERLFRDARAALVMSPTVDMLYDFVGKIVCGMPPF